MTIFLVIVAIIVLLALVVVWYYNTFVVKRNRVDQAFSTIDVLLKNRHDLLPNLVASVTRYMKHETDTLTRITELRSLSGDSKNAPDARIAADTEIQRLLGGLKVQFEQYPELKADLQIMGLMASLETMESQLVSARRTYNAVVTDFNNTQQMFPGNLLAGRLGFTCRELLKTPDEERLVPSVKKLFEA